MELVKLLQIVEVLRDLGVSLVKTKEGLWRLYVKKELVCEGSSKECLDALKVALEKWGR